jgi:hypothetical protein
VLWPQPLQQSVLQGVFGHLTSLSRSLRRFDLYFHDDGRAAERLDSRRFHGRFAPIAVVPGRPWTTREQSFIQVRACQRSRAIHRFKGVRSASRSLMCPATARYLAQAARRTAAGTLG